MSKVPVRKHQCDACPWKKTTRPERDIPGGYCETKHANLRNTLAVPGEVSAELRIMACHETERGRDLACTGWVAHQLGPGNNIALRFSLLGQKLDLVFGGSTARHLRADLTEAPQVTEANMRPAPTIVGYELQRWRTSFCIAIHSSTGCRRSA